ncbi:MAG: cyclophilin-like fold protein [Mobilitalea sp.]
MNVTRKKIILLISFIFVALSINAQGTMRQDVEKTLIIITINNKEFMVELVNNQTSQNLLGRLPITIEMSDLNKNEKFYYFKDKFPTTIQTIGNIKAGDLMLYGDDCLVLFYESFSTTYRYTKIGSIVDTKGLTNVLGPDSVRISFKRK